MELMFECKSDLRLKESGKLLRHYRFPSFRLSNDAEVKCEVVVIERESKQRLEITARTAARLQPDGKSRAAQRASLPQLCGL
jgi:hypothetical protein